METENEVFDAQQEAIKQFKFDFKIIGGTTVAVMFINFLFAILFSHIFISLNNEFSDWFFRMILFPMLFLSLAVVNYVLPVVIPKPNTKGKLCFNTDFIWIVKEQHTPTAMRYKIIKILTILFFILGILSFIATFVYVTMGVFYY